MVLLVEQVAHRRHVDLGQIGHLAYDAYGAQDGLLLQVRIGVLDELLHVDGQIAAHLGRQDRAERAQRQAGDVLIRVAQVVLQALRDEKMNVLAFVEQQHGAQVADALVRVARRRDQLQTLQLQRTIA